MSDQVINSIRMESNEEIKEENMGFSFGALLLGPIHAALNGAWKTGSIYLTIIIGILFSYYMVCIGVYCCDPYAVDYVIDGFSKIWDNYIMWIIISVIYGFKARYFYAKEKSIIQHKTGWKIAFWILLVVGIINDTFYFVSKYLID